MPASPPAPVARKGVQIVEPRSDSMQDSDALANAAPALMAAPAESRRALPPKGSCWYCDKPVDSVRRFCGKDCTSAFDEEAAFTR